MIEVFESRSTGHAAEFGAVSTLLPLVSYPTHAIGRESDLRYRGARLPEK